MSAQAMGWALKQKIPGTAKLVLYSLCNYADHRTGHCWPSVEIIAEEASCSRRSVFTYLAALQRNGYVEIQSAKRKTGEQRSNNYWVIFDRDDTPWDFGKGANTAGDPLDIVENEEKDTEFAPSNNESKIENQPTGGADSAHLAHGPGANSAPHIEPLRIYPSESLRTEESERRPSAMRTAHHDPTARKKDQARFRAAEQARKPTMVPVIEGTRAWAAWLRDGHRPGLVATVIVNGERKRGWYFPSLFPPNSTGPPIEELAVELDDETIAAE
jgi:hypothetical protein